MQDCNDVYFETRDLNIKLVNLCEEIFNVDEDRFARVDCSE